MFCSEYLNCRTPETSQMTCASDQMMNQVITDDKLCQLTMNCCGVAAAAHLFNEEIIWRHSL